METDVAGVNFIDQFHRASDAANELIGQRGCFGDAEAIETIADEVAAAASGEALDRLVITELRMRAEHIRSLPGDSQDG